MKLKIFLVFFLLLLLLPCTDSHARKGRYLTYEVMAVTEDTVTSRYHTGKEYVLQKDPKGLKVGDKVRYNKRRKLLRHMPQEEGGKK